MYILHLHRLCMKHLHESVKGQYTHLVVLGILRDTITTRSTIICSIFMTFLSVAAQAKTEQQDSATPPYDPQQVWTA